ncbi:MAG: hypothetical protein OXB95_07545 [Rhodobacteraceae bacterium]|nr:hypothetical protein [Paracoccaceae bacterium]
MLEIRAGGRLSFTTNRKSTAAHPPSVDHMAFNPDRAGFIDASLDNQGSMRAINNPNKLSALKAACLKPLQLPIYDTSKII